NLESAIDDAFSRRLTCRLELPEPTDEERLEIWRRLLPRGAAFAPDVDCARLARDFDFTGARIRNALARAAYLVAETGAGAPGASRGAAPGAGARAVLGDAVLRRAARTELEDMGRVVAGPALAPGPSPLRARLSRSV